MSNSGQNTLIIILSGILIAAVLAAGVIVFLGSDSTSDLTGGFWSRINIFSPDSLTTQSDSQIVVPEFNTNTLNRKSYTELNTSLINSGLLPVRPDPAAGKANPFL